MCIYCSLTSSLTSCSIAIMTSDDKRRVTIFIHPAIVKHARAQAVVEEITLTELVEKALDNYLSPEIIIKKPELI